MSQEVVGGEVSGGTSGMRTSTGPEDMYATELVATEFCQQPVDRGDSLYFVGFAGEDGDPGGRLIAEIRESGN